jgi:CelD/BcsL family acetyltransferase involved in cellulose biosynthesis
VLHADSAWSAAAGAGITGQEPLHAQSPALSAEVHDGADAYRDLRPAWLALTRRMGRPAIFQSPDFLAIWAASFAAGAAARRLRTIVVRRAGVPVLIWPLVVGRRGPVRLAWGAGAPVGQYDGLLLDPAADAPQVLQAAYDALLGSAGIDLIRLDRVRGDSPLQPFLAERGEAVGETDFAPYADLPAAGFDAFMAGVKPRVQQHQRRRTRLLEEIGECRFAVADEPRIVAAWLNEAIALKRRWLVDTGRLSNAFVERLTTECLLALADGLCRPDSPTPMLAARFEVGGQGAAIGAGFVDSGTYHAYIGAFHPDFTRFGPGNLLTERMIAWCCARGLKRYDMLAPRARSKSEWQTGEVPVTDFALPLTASGRRYAEIIERRLKPALRGAFYTLPLPVRSALAGRIFRL